MTRSRLNLARQIASMKVPPERKGNLRWLVRACSANLTLNESPCEKEGKSVAADAGGYLVFGDPQ